MTEVDWFEARAPGRLVFHVENMGSERKLRLFAVACCHPIERLLIDARSRAALATLETYSDGGCGLAELDNCFSQAKEAVDAIESSLYGDDGILETNAESMAACAVMRAVNPNITPTRNDNFAHSAISSVAIYASGAAASVVFKRAGTPSPEVDAVEKAQKLGQVHLLHDIFGNPFSRRPTITPSLLTPSITALAHDIYNRRDFSRLGEAADLLAKGPEHGPIPALPEPTDLSA